MATMGPKITTKVTAAPTKATARPIGMLLCLVEAAYLRLQDESEPL